MLSHCLPRELMEEIMARLPVKSLLRFKSVAKSWYVLITDTSFITKRLECSKNLCQKLMFRNITSVYVPPSVSRLYNREKPCLVQHFEWALHGEIDLNLYWISVYGECNGIFFLHLSLFANPLIFERGIPAESPPRLILWNPTTKEVKPIPAPPCQGVIKRATEAMFGFGFDPITKDYNVVGFPVRYYKGQQFRVEVYTLSTNSWRTIDVDVPIFYLYYPPGGSYWNGSYLNGAHHWLTNEDHNNINKLIVSFDFSKKVFGVIRVPPIFTFSDLTKLVLTVVDENLAIIFTYQSFMTTQEQDHHAEIWVMNEYGIESSWTKKFKIGPFSNFVDILGFWGDGEILVNQHYGKLILYNIQNHQRRKFQIHFGRWARLRMMDYVESFSSLHGKGKHIKI